MESRIDRAGRIWIELNAQTEVLQAPPAPDGAPRKYLPCDADCGALLIVPMNVVARTCYTCAAADADEPACPACGGNRADCDAGYYTE